MMRVVPEDLIQRLYNQAEEQASSLMSLNAPIDRYIRSLPSLIELGDQKLRKREFNHAYLIYIKIMICVSK